MYCKNCGKELSNTDKFCDACGSSQKTELKEYAKTILYIVGIILIVMLMQASIIYFTRDSAIICGNWYLCEWKTGIDMSYLEKTDDVIEFQKDGTFFYNSEEGIYELLPGEKIQIEIGGDKYLFKYKFDCDRLKRLQKSNIILKLKGDEKTIYLQSAD